VPVVPRATSAPGRGAPPQILAADARLGIAALQTGGTTAKAGREPSVGSRGPPSPRPPPAISPAPPGMSCLSTEPPPLPVTCASAGASSSLSSLDLDSTGHLAPSAGAPPPPASSKIPSPLGQHHLRDVAPVSPEAALSPLLQGALDEVANAAEWPGGSAGVGDEGVCGPSAGATAPAESQMPPERAVPVEAWSGDWVLTTPEGAAGRGVDLASVPLPTGAPAPRDEVSVDPEVLRVCALAPRKASLERGAHARRTVG